MRDHSPVPLHLTTAGSCCICKLPGGLQSGRSATQHLWRRENCGDGEQIDTGAAEHEWSAAMRGGVRVGAAAFSLIKEQQLLTPRSAG